MSWCRVAELWAIAGRWQENRLGSDREEENDITCTARKYDRRTEPEGI